MARLIGPHPEIDPPPPAWQRSVARLAHLAFYVLLIGMPLGGWTIVSAEGEPVLLFGLKLPALVGENARLAETVERFHEIGGTVGYFLVGIHAAAALIHHYFIRDSAFTTMHPIRPR